MGIIDTYTNKKDKIKFRLKGKKQKKRDVFFTFNRISNNYRRLLMFYILLIVIFNIISINNSDLNEINNFEKVQLQVYYKLNYLADNNNNNNNQSEIFDKSILDLSDSLSTLDNELNFIESAIISHSSLSFSIFSSSELIKIQSYLMFSSKNLESLGIINITSGSFPDSPNEIILDNRYNINFSKIDDMNNSLQNNDLQNISYNNNSLIPEEYCLFSINDTLQTQSIFFNNNEIKRVDVNFRIVGFYDILDFDSFKKINSLELGNKNFKKSESIVENNNLEYNFMKIVLISNIFQSISGTLESDNSSFSDFKNINRIVWFLKDSVINKNYDNPINLNKIRKDYNKVEEWINDRSINTIDPKEKFNNYNERSYLLLNDFGDYITLNNAKQHGSLAVFYYSRFAISNLFIDILVYSVPFLIIIFGYENYILNREFESNKKEFEREFYYGWKRSRIKKVYNISFIRILSMNSILILLYSIIFGYFLFKVENNYLSIVYERILNHVNNSNNNLYLQQNLRDFILGLINYLGALSDNQELYLKFILFSFSIVIIDLIFLIVLNWKKLSKNLEYLYDNDAGLELESLNVHDDRIKLQQDVEKKRLKRIIILSSLPIFSWLFLYINQVTLLNSSDFSLLLLMILFFIVPGLYLLTPSIILYFHPILKELVKKMLSFFNNKFPSRKNSCCSKTSIFVRKIIINKSIIKKSRTLLFVIPLIYLSIGATFLHFQDLKEKQEIFYNWNSSIMRITSRRPIYFQDYNTFKNYSGGSLVLNLNNKYNISSDFYSKFSFYSFQAHAFSIGIGQYNINVMGALINADSYERFLDLKSTNNIFSFINFNQGDNYDLPKSQENDIRDSISLLKNNKTIKVIITKSIAAEYGFSLGMKIQISYPSLSSDGFFFNTNVGIIEIGKIVDRLPIINYNGDFPIDFILPESILNIFSINLTNWNVFSSYFSFLKVNENEKCSLDLDILYQDLINYKEYLISRDSIFRDIQLISIDIKSKDIVAYNSPSASVIEDFLKLEAIIIQICYIFIVFKNLKDILEDINEEYVFFRYYSSRFPMEFKRLFQNITNIYLAFSVFLVFSFSLFNSIITWSILSILYFNGIEFNVYDGILSVLLKHPLGREHLWNQLISFQLIITWGVIWLISLLILLISFIFLPKYLIKLKINNDIQELGEEKMGDKKKIKKNKEESNKKV